MKRTRYDSEYERVRRSAGLPYATYDLPEEPDASGQMAPDRVEAALGDFKQRMGALEAQDAAAAAERKAKADALTARANATVLIHEYAAQGIHPPLTDGRGVPTVSLAMLLQIGWTIQRVGDGLALLLRPEPKPEQLPRKRMEDYDQST